MKLWWETNAFRAVFLVVFIGALLYAFDHPAEPLGIVIIATLGLFIGLYVFSYYVGLKRPIGSRFKLGWGVFQYLHHPYKRMTAEEERAAWQLLGQQPGALPGGWSCPAHCRQQYFVGESNGVRYYVFAHVPPEPLVRWVAGYLVVYGKDAPLSDIPVREPASV